MGLENALLPLIRLLQITLLNPFSAKSSDRISMRFNVCSLIVIVLIILLTLHGFVDPSFKITEDSSIGDIIMFLKLCGVRVGHVVILIESFAKRRELMQLIKILSSIDAILEDKLGVNVGHNRLRKMVVVSLTLTFSVLATIEIGVLIIDLNHSKPHFLAFWLFRLFSLLIICLRYLQIMTLVYVIQSRVSIINQNLKRIGTEENHGKLISTIGFLKEDNREVLKTQRKPFTDFEKMSILRELFGRLWDVTNFVNQCFGISLLVAIGDDFSALVLNAYWMYLSYKEKAKVIYICGITLWSLPHLAFLILTAGFCYNTVEKANETALIVHKIDFNSMDGDHRDFDSRIEQFSLQLLHQKLAFNACGFFVINFTLIFTIIGAMTTYLVILIQFQMIS